MMALVLSLVLALFCAAIAWCVKPLRNWLIAVVLAVGIVLSVLGAVFSPVEYPWTNIVVLLVAMSAGLLLGRAMSTKVWPFLLLLIVLSILDVVQIVLTSGSPSPGTSSAGVPTAQLYGNFLLRLPWGRYNIGIFDLLLMTAMAEYWRKRGSDFLMAVAPGAIGLILAVGAGQFITGGLPLIPFLTAGWLVSVAIHRFRQRSERRLAGEKLNE